MRLLAAILTCGSNNSMLKSAILRNLKHITFLTGISLVSCLNHTLVGRTEAAISSKMWMISGNESKIDLISGAPRVVPTSEPDSLTVIDFSAFPPRTTHLMNVPNSVIGPPSNIAISPLGDLALVANSIKIESRFKTNWVTENYIHILDLKVNPPRVIGKVEAGEQPSGISFTADGKLALVANRGAGSISVLGISEQKVRLLQTLNVCTAADAVSDVAISSDRRTVLASVQKGGYIARLALQGDRLIWNTNKISVYGQPYRCVVTPDGALGLTAGQGAGNGFDTDALTIIDLNQNPPRAIEFVALGVVPESIEISPDGRMLAAVCMNGSNLPTTDSMHKPQGELVILSRQKSSFKVVQRHPIGRIPEGVSFTSDGRHLVVQCHADRNLWVFRVTGGKVVDTEVRLTVPGMPSSLRAHP